MRSIVVIHVTIKYIPKSNKIYFKVAYLYLLRTGLMAHAYSLSYLGSRDWEDCSLRTEQPA
jgi:hypothetical protein